MDGGGDKTALYTKVQPKTDKKRKFKLKMYLQTQSEEVLVSVPALFASIPHKNMK